ncbi:hypothetical protein Tamer19_08410 [Cupriavidus sp. TA19]|uniref:hypothetical protein n=1 Tax=unclassified Cupriavidus TaxID=2640874 RepID=UPI0027294D96|nr:hypothetical protein [Cupriavidus sp. TA19]GLC91433.1 hypothetical protein Tamer19_08410 [Cupriavidus sp. TA19]
MDSDPQQPPVRPDVLDRDAVIRWEVIRNDPLVSRHVLARLLPQAIESSEQLREFEEESRRAVPLLIALERIAAKLAGVLARLGLVILALFGIVWFAAGLVGHLAILSAVAYGMAAYFTGSAAYWAMTYVLSVSETSRQKMVGRIKVAGLMAMPLLMYATACPTTTIFIDPALQEPPSMLSWLGFFAYMFADVVSLGVPQALFGELAAFQPPSLLAAANTLWAKSLMTFAVAGTVVSTMIKVIATRHTFVGSLDELTEWLAVEFPGGDPPYTVRPIALERAFAFPDSGVSLRLLRDHVGLITSVSPPWRVDARGKFVHPFGEGEDYDKVRNAVYSLMGMSYKVYKVFNPREVEAKDRAQFKESLGALRSFLFSAALVFVPAWALLAGLLDYGRLEATAAAFLITVLVLTLALLIEQRHKRELLLDLLHCKTAALSGNDSRVPTRFPALDRLVIRLNSILFFRSLQQAKTSLEQILQSPAALGRLDFFELMVFDGSNEVWLLHAMPFHMQGKLVKAVYEEKRRVFVFFDAASSEEEFDFLDVPLPNALHQRLSSCRKLTLLHCPAGRAPSKPWHVQEMPLDIPLTPNVLPVHEQRLHYRDQVARKQTNTVGAAPTVEKTLPGADA